MPQQPPQTSKDKRYLSVVSHFAIEMLSLSSEDEVVWYLARDVVAQLGYVDAVIYLFNRHKNVLVQAAAFGNKNPEENQIVDPLEVSFGQGVVGKAALSMSPVVVSDTRQNPDYIIDDDARLSEIAVPIQMEGELIGVIDSEHPERGFFSKQDEQILTAIASMAATKIQKIRAMGTLQSMIDELQQNMEVQDTLFEIAELVHKSSSVEDFYQSIHKCMMKILDARNFIVAIEDKENNAIRFEYCSDQVDDYEDNTIPLNFERPNITGYILKTQKALLVTRNDLMQMVDNQLMQIEGTLPEVLLGVPFGNGDTRGVVIIQSYDSKKAYTYSDKQLMEYVANHIHIALKRIEAKAELEFLALHDPLTSLPNRVLLSSKVNSALQTCSEQPDKLMAVLFLDLDKFKEINDSYGHHIGDKLLINIAKGLKKVMRDSDTLARIGGDEFAIVLENLESEEHILSIAERIIEKVKEPIYHGKTQLSTTVSIGVTTHSDGYVSEEQLLIEADEAMYLAKLKGRNQVFFHNKLRSGSNIHSHKLEIEFSEAMKNNDLYLVFQPIVDLHTKQITSAECLIRWSHPTLGDILPASFINELQRIGKLIELDIYVLKTALNNLVSLQKHFDKDFRVSINVSPTGFASKTFVDAVKAMTIEYPHLIKHLIFEITEQSLLENFEEVASKLEWYRSLGIQIALDDFGTGYSSLSYLHKFHFDILKIDRSFIITEQKSVKSAIILDALVSLARALEIKTTAEGIEDESQLAWMKDIGCNSGQGYLFSRPVKLEKFTALIRKPGEAKKLA